MNMSERLDRRSVVTAFLMHGDRLLLVKRSGAVGTYQGLWSAISGYLESEPLQQALTEIREETGLKNSEVQLLVEGSLLEVADESLNICWTIHPFLFEVRNPQHIVLDWENLESRWVTPSELAHYPTVPALKEAYESCQARLNAELNGRS